MPARLRDYHHRTFGLRAPAVLGEEMRNDGGVRRRQQGRSRSGVLRSRPAAPPQPPAPQSHPLQMIHHPNLLHQLNNIGTANRVLESAHAAWGKYEIGAYKPPYDLQRSHGGVHPPAASKLRGEVISGAASSPAR